MQREIAHNIATGERRTTDVAPGKVKTFSELNLRREIVLGLQRRNFLTPTMIQAAAIPIALSRKDMLIQSKSGTGKTLIYAIAALQAYDALIKTPQALVVVPTRELAAQVMETFSYLGEFLPKLKVGHFVGGTEISSDRRRIRNTQIIIGTPGRLLHIYKKNVLCVKTMSLLVLDEADQLYLQESLHRQVTELIREMPRQIQKIACSATYERNLDELVAKSMDKPLLISNSERATVLLGIRQFVYELPRQINNIEQMNCKLDAVMKIFNLVPYDQVVLFASSKMRADSFRNYLARRGVECHLISGAMSQEERSEVFDCYRYFKMRTLVATDVFARGVDSPHTNLIVNLDPPKDHVDYLHRIGRAGRFGSKGIAISLVYEDEESVNFKGILRKAHTGKSVLEFPKEAEKGLDFWNFTTYDFPYYIKEEEKEQLHEFPKEEGTPKGAVQTEEQAGDAALKKHALEKEVTSMDGDASKEVEPMPMKADPKEEDTPKMLEIDKKTIDKSAEGDKASTEDVSSKNECVTNEKPAFQHEDVSKKNHVAEEERGANDKDSTEKEKSTSCPNYQVTTPDISIIASHKLKQTIQQALMEGKLESSGEEDHPESPKQLGNNDTPKLNSIIVENTLQPNNSHGKDKPDKASVKELISPGKEQAYPPMIQVTKLEMENDTENNKENLPNNKNAQIPEEFVSPELTPSSLTQEHTLTPPAPPVNSINTKTYCLAAPTATSSLTLQAMVISNTVDDASSISSDGSMGSRSDSYSSLYSSTDVKLIWNKFLIIQRRLQRSAKIQTPKLIYNWPTYTPVPRVKRKRKVKIQSPKLNYNWPLYRPISRVKRKRKVKPMNIIYETLCLLPPQKYFRLIDKLEHSEAIAKGLIRYSNKRKMSNHDANLFLKLLYDAYDETYGFKSISEPRKSKDNEPHNMLSVRVAHRLNIPPAPVADEDIATDSEANEASQHSEEINDDEEDFEEEEEEVEGNSSSGFVESNESASSGIDTSVYNTQTSTEGDEEYQSSDYDENDSASSLYGSESPEDELEWEGEDGQEDDSTGSNVSLAGTSYQGSVSAADEDLRAEESEELDAYADQSDMQQETLAVYQQIFQTQYQFIVDHVASHLARP